MKKLTAIISLLLVLALSLSACVITPDAISATPSEEALSLYEGESANLSYTFSEDVTNLEHLSITSSISTVATVNSEVIDGTKVSFTVTAKEAGTTEIYPLLSGKELVADKISLTVEEAPETDGG